MNGNDGIDASKLGRPLLEYLGIDPEDIRIGLDGLPLLESDHDGDNDPAVIDYTIRWAEQLLTGQEP